MSGNNSISPHELRLQKMFYAMFEDCYLSVLSKPYPNDGHVYCSASQDAFMGCWNYTRAGDRALIPCPGIPGFKTTEFAYKDCTENGTWYINPETTREYAEYGACRNINESLKEMIEDHIHIYMSIVGFSLSLVMLLISLVIFFKFRQLRCDRITIHKNLFISYAITDLTNILYFVLVTLRGDVMFQNPVWCQILHVVTQYSIVCNFAWMFCEGLYLHTVMMRAFTSGKLLVISCLIIGWCVPFGLAAIYAGVRATEENRLCWIEESSLQWIIFAPIVISMALNVFFVFNIIRLLITKLRQIPEAAQTRKAARATAILIPLLGVQFLIFPMRPEDKSSTLHKVYLIALSAFTSLQGAFVSIMYCFCNGEVHSLLKRKWNQHKAMVPGKRKRKASAVLSTGSTTYTFVDQACAVQTSVT